MRTYRNLLPILLFISLVHVNIAIDTTCNTRIDVIHSLTTDGFLRNHQYLSQWFHRKYPSCSSFNDLNIIGEMENAKENDNAESFDRTNEVYHQRYDGDKVKKHLLKWNDKKENNVNGDSNKKAVVLKTIAHNNMKKEEDGKYRLLHLGRALIGEWNEQTSGTYILSNDVNTTGTIYINGNALEITGIVGVDGVRPAIDGGGTPGGHRVFYVMGYGTKLTLTGITIRNGYVSRCSFHFQVLYNGMTNCFLIM